MIKGRLASLALVASLISPTALAADNGGDGGEMAQEIASVGPLYVLAGVRVWANQWDILYLSREVFLANPADPSSAMLRESVRTATSSTRTVPIPFLGLRYGKFIGSVSYFPETGFDTDGALSEDVDREELDVNFGYYLTSNVVVSLGYREGRQSKATDFAEDSALKARGILVGTSFTAPVTGPLSVYGNVAYGWVKLKVDSTLLLPDGSDELNGNYKVGEIGLSYNLSHLVGGSVLKGAALTLGYRIWVITEKNVPLGAYETSNPTLPVSFSEVDARTTTDGFIIGAVAVF